MVMAGAYRKWGRTPGVGGHMIRDRLDFWGDVVGELNHAYAKHGRDQWGRHEMYAILKEEVDELWDAIKRDAGGEEVYSELVQVAAMCVRYVETGNRYHIGPKAGVL